MLESREESAKEETTLCSVAKRQIRNTSLTWALVILIQYFQIAPNALIVEPYSVLDELTVAY